MLAVIEDRHVVAISRAAAQLGVRIGQSSATAQSLVPQLQLLPRDETRERAYVHALALTLGAFTPRIGIEASGVLLEVQASLRLFGGLRRLRRRIDALTRQYGARTRIAMARTAGAAWLLAIARAGRAGTVGSSAPARATGVAGDARRLDALSLDVLRGPTLSPQQLEGLNLLGLRRLGELRALPRAGLRRRFGGELLKALDHAYGDAAEPREWLTVPEHFALRCELMQRADDAAPITAAVQALLPALGGWLQLRWEAATVLALRLRHEHGRTRMPDTRLVLRLSTPSRDIDQLALLWRERLARHALAAPVYEIALELDASAPHAGQPGELLPVAGGDATAYAALLDRLTARLGTERVLRCEPLPDHRPERAQRVVPAGAARSALPVASPAETAGSARPVWLLDPPQPLDCDGHDRPLHGGPLQLCSGAERIEAGWFDGALVCRDYQVAEGRDHRLRWIYRERMPDGSTRWFLHGWFA